jgi:hypothetical protein
VFYFYQKMPEGNAHRYSMGEETSLFGCNVGFIAKSLGEILHPSDSEPNFCWHLSVQAAIERLGRRDQTLVIDLMPNADPPNLSLYEVADIWGYSDHGWTPIMLHLRALFIEADPAQHDKRDFVRQASDIEEPIFSMTYLKGSVRQGKICGKWLPPGPSSTNSVLLWPEVFDYFVAERGKIVVPSV